MGLGSFISCLLLASKQVKSVIGLGVRIQLFHAEKLRPGFEFRMTQYFFLLHFCSSFSLFASCNYTGCAVFKL
ncbi:hypothetical protein GGI43DRAFT_404742 [Trichoderma evansii]